MCAGRLWGGPESYCPETMPIRVLFYAQARTRKVIAAESRTKGNGTHDNLIHPAPGSPRSLRRPHGRVRAGRRGFLPRGGGLRPSTIRGGTRLEQSEHGISARDLPSRVRRRAPVCALHPEG